MVLLRSRRSVTLPLPCGVVVVTQERDPPVPYVVAVTQERAPPVVLVTSKKAHDIRKCRAPLMI